jgi:hypothetical protein
MKTARPYQKEIVRKAVDEIRMVRICPVNLKEQSLLTKQNAIL